MKNKYGQELTTTAVTEQDKGRCAPAPGSECRTLEDWATAIGKVTGTGHEHQSDLNVLVQAIQAAALREAAHPAFRRTWWLNLYPDGQCTGMLCNTRESALNRCTYTGDTPDAIQVEVRIIPNSMFGTKSQVQRQSQKPKSSISGSLPDRQQGVKPVIQDSSAAQAELNSIAVAL